MTITTKGELETAITEWMHRSGLSGRADDFIKLAEAQFNRRIKPIRVDDTLTGTVSSRTIDISAYSVIEVLGIWNTYYTGPDIVVPIKPDGSFRYTDVNGPPKCVAVDNDNDNLDFNCPLDTAYTFRMRSRQRFALTTSGSTNRLLTEHPDIYLSGCIVWGNIYTRNTPRVMEMRQMLEQFMYEANDYFAQSERGEMRVDPALSRGNGRYNIYSD